MAKRTRMHGQCSKCKTIYPAETSDFFYEHRRRGRIELRSVCRKCYAVECHDRGQRNAVAIAAYGKKRRERPAYREYMRAAWRKFHAKPEYKNYDRALYRKLVATPDGREKARVKVRRRRARVMAAPGHHTARDVRIALEVQQGLCFYCQTDVSTKYTVDHLLPLVRGGSDGPENIVIACANCNFRKADKTPDEFAAGTKHERLLWRNASRVNIGPLAE